LLHSCFHWELLKQSLYTEFFASLWCLPWARVPVSLLHPSLHGNVLW